MPTTARKQVSSLSPSDGVLVAGVSRISLEAAVADTLRSIAAAKKLSISELLEQCLLAYGAKYGIDVHQPPPRIDGRRKKENKTLSQTKKDIIDAFRMMCLLYSKQCDVTDLLGGYRFYEKSGRYDVFVQIIESYVSQSEKESCSFTDMNTIGFKTLAKRERNNIKWTPEMVREDLKNLQEANRQDLQSPTSSPSEPEEALVPSVQPSSESLSPSEEPQDSDLP
jgi:hypothetical protein